MQFNHAARIFLSPLLHLVSDYIFHFCVRVRHRNRTSAGALALAWLRSAPDTTRPFAIPVHVNFSKVDI